MDKKSEKNTAVVNPPSIADKIWNDIKEKKIEIFALPDQFVSNYCQPIIIEPSKLYLTFSVSAFLPALELALKDVYSVERMDKYICVSPIVKK